MDTEDERKFRLKKNQKNAINTIMIERVNVLRLKIFERM